MKMVPSLSEQTATGFISRSTSLRANYSGSSSFKGFTLIEIVLVLTLLIVIIAASVPAVQGLKDEQIAREPVAALAAMAKETRLHAMSDKRPYQIAFTSRGFSATRYFSPYIQAAQLEEFMQKVQNDTAEREELGMSEEEAQAIKDKKANPSGTASAPSDHPFKEWTQSYKLPENTHYSTQFWYETEPIQIEGEIVKLWVFQPSGIVAPLTVHLARESATFDASFNALTADIVKEVSDRK
jgi:type II secretory pathway pseudopilin PulG